MSELGDWRDLERDEIHHAVVTTIELIDDGFPHHARTVLFAMLTRLNIDASVEEFAQLRAQGESHAIRQ